ncbi:MAG: hypothetical protein CM15mP22_3710 [Gammaproteobacteria bacterium]|nr:MAG: hypothetical protein CM15mP22_3710 [Gammaproteobacteria bacterium]
MEVTMKLKKKPSSLGLEFIKIENCFYEIVLPQNGVKQTHQEKKRKGGIRLFINAWLSES